MRENDTSNAASSNAVPSVAVLPAVAITGIGAVTHLGRGLDEIAAQLSHENSLTSTQPAASPGLTPKAVDDALLFDPKLDRKLRRADRYVRMSCMAALDAWEQAQPVVASSDMSKVGMIIASGFGPHQRGFRFLDGLLDHGDTAASPTDFSHSVHGSASAYISGLLEMRGPTFTITDFHAGFAQAIQLAQCWIHQQQCDHVLVGATEELGAVLLSLGQQLLPAGTHYNAGEGSLFLVLSRAQPHASQGLRIAADTLTHNANQNAKQNTKQNVDLLIHQSDVFTSDAHTPPAELSFKTQTTFLNSFGRNASTLAFETLGGIVAMNHPKLPICRTAASHRPVAAGPIDSALTYVSLSQNQFASVLLTRDA